MSVNLLHYILIILSNSKSKASLSPALKGALPATTSKSNYTAKSAICFTHSYDYKEMKKLATLGHQ